MPCKFTLQLYFSDNLGISLLKDVGRSYQNKVALLKDGINFAVHFVYMIC